MVAILGMAFSVVWGVLPAQTHKGPDVELIANWVCGKDPSKAFDKPFSDSKFLAHLKDSSLFYTDFASVDAPSGLKAVNYEFVQARMRMIRGGHRVAPAVLIVRSSWEEPADDGKIRVYNGDPAARVYYVEVAIGNLAWHWLKVVVRDVNGKPKAEVLWTRVS